MACEHNQIAGVDYDENYSPVIHDVSNHDRLTNYAKTWVKDC